MGNNTGRLWLNRTRLDLNKLKFVTMLGKLVKYLDLTDERFHGLDILIKGIGIAAILVSGYFGYTQYKEGQQREFKKAFYEKQVAVVSSVFEVLSELELAKTDDEKQIAAKKFWMIYLGSGRAFLSVKMYEALNGFPVDYVGGCIQKLRPTKIINDCKNFSASMSSTGFARVAREELTSNWSVDFKQIGIEDPLDAKRNP